MSSGAGLKIVLEKHQAENGLLGTVPFETDLGRRAIIEGGGGAKGGGSKGDGDVPGKPVGSTGESGGTESGADPNSIPGNPGAKSGGGSKGSGEDGQSNADPDSIPGNPDATRPDSLPEEGPKNGPNEDPNKTPSDTEPGKAKDNPNCKRGLNGRADCSDDSDVAMSDEEEYRSSDEEVAAADEEMRSDSEDSKGWPQSDNDAPNRETADMLKPYVEKDIRDAGVKAQEFLIGKTPADKPFTESYQDRYYDVLATKPELKMRAPDAAVSSGSEADVVAVFDKLGIQRESSVTDWQKVNLKSAEPVPGMEGGMNSAYYSGSQRTICVDEFRRAYDGNAPADQLPASELNRQVYEGITGNNGFRYVVQTRIAGKGSKKAIKELYNKNGWAPTEYHSFELNLNRDVPIDPKSDTTLVCGIDNVKGFLRMAATNGKPIERIHIWGKGPWASDPAIAIEFAV